MSQYKGKVAVVTGASAGIGAIIAKDLVNAGLQVVGFSRRKERVEELAEELKEAEGKLHSVKVDLTNEDDILEAFKWVSDNVGPISVLINNAGILVNTTLVDGVTAKWKTVLDTNVLGLTIATREAIKIMRQNDIAGHIININSICGHKVYNSAYLNIYTASKYAVTALTESFRLELIRLESKIKISSVSPGPVDTEILLANDSKSAEEYEEWQQFYPYLLSEDVSNAVLYVLNTPAHVQVTELTIRPVGDKFV